MGRACHGKGAWHVPGTCQAPYGAFDGTCVLRYDAFVTRLSADAHVALQLQVHHRRHRPEIDRDVGIDLLRIDLPRKDPLTADANVDAGLLERVDDRDV